VRSQSAKRSPGQVQLESPGRVKDRFQIESRVRIPVKLSRKEMRRESEITKIHVNVQLREIMKPENV
jgi:hypothetical protein